MVIMEEDTKEIISAQPDFPPGMAPKMLKLMKVLQDLQSKMEPLVSESYHTALSKLSAMEKAKVGLMELYTINSLFWVLMKTSGEDIGATLREDYKLEMGRVKEIQGKLSEIEARSRRSRLDMQAASRFIHHGLGIQRRKRRGDYVEEEEPMDEGYQEEEVEQVESEHWAAEAHRAHCRPGFFKPEYQEEDVDRNYQEYDENEGEDSSYNLNEKKTKKKTKVTGNKNGVADLSPTKSLGKKITKKKKVKATINSVADSSPAKEGLKKKKGLKNLKKKKGAKETELDNSGLQSTDAELEAPVPMKKTKKKRTIAEGASTNQETVTLDQDNDSETETPCKKKKKKARLGKKVNAADIASFLDTTRASINYEIGDGEEDLNNKGKNWFEQGWT